MRLPTRKNTEALEILQESDKDTSGDDEPTTRVLEKLNRLNLDDDSSKLIPRGQWPKDTQPNKGKPYSAPPVRENVNVRQYVSYNHSCRGIFISTEQTEVATNSYNLSVATTPVQWNSDYIVCTCDTCKLQMVNLPEFFDFFIEECRKYKVPMTELNNKKETKSETVVKEQTKEITKPNMEFIRPPARRFSEDSGFQSDIASPFSDTVLSPKPSSTQANESQQRCLRKILPKSDTNGSSSSSEQPSAQKLLKSTLIPDIKQIKWIEVLRKSEDDIFGKDNDGRTILHKLLESDEKYMAESFYATVERLKKNPTKCQEIIESESSICDAISDDLLLDYFKESLNVMQNITN